MKSIAQMTAKTFLVLSMMAALAVPAFIYAQTQPTGTDGGVGSDIPNNNNFQIVPCTGTATDAQGNKTGVECDFNQLLGMVNRIIKFLLFFSIPLVLGIIMYTAFKFLTANGDPGKLADAKKMLVPVFIGLFWVLASYIVVYTVLDKLLDDSAGSDAKGILNQYFKN